MDVVISLMLNRDIILLHIFCDIINSISLNFNHVYKKNKKFILDNISFS